MNGDTRLHSIIHGIMETVSADTTPDQLYQAWETHFREFLPPHSVDSFTVTLLEPLSNMIKFAYFSNALEPIWPSDRPLSEKSGLADWVITNKKSKIWKKGDTDILPPPKALTTRYGTPLMVQSHVFGALIFGSYIEGMEYSVEDQALIDQATNDLSMLYRMYEEIRTKKFIINNPHVPFMVCRMQDGLIIDINDKAGEMLGYRMDEMMGAPFLDFHPEPDRQRILEKYQKHIQGVPMDMHYYTHLLMKNGNLLPVEISIALGDFYYGRPVVIAICVDVTEVKRIEHEAEENRGLLERATREDLLTGLLNKNSFLEEMQIVLDRTQSRDFPGATLTALLVLDLDNFKAVNWFRGTATGDVLLKLVAERIRICIRQTDLLCRMDGNRFSLLLETIHDLEAVKEKTQRLLNSVSLPFAIGDATVNITASIGVSVFRHHGNTMEELVKNAEAALSVAKKHRNKFSIVDDAIIQEFTAGLSYQEELKLALSSGEFTAWYQPKFDRTGSITGAEALARWNSPTRGVVPPGKFIATLERMGLIGELGRQMCDQACAFSRAVIDSGHTEFGIAVNISPRQLDDPDFLEKTAGIALKAGLPPGTVEFEITESAIMSSENLNYTLIETIKKLRNMGIKISIDDFGTGTSSLSRLRTLAQYVDKLKIDKSFVDQIGVDDGGNAYFSAILNLARSLDTKDKKIAFVIEGIETKIQADFLLGREFGDIPLDLQGYYFGKPMCAEDFMNRLRG